MIARTWHGRVPTDRADEYVGVVRRTGLQAFARTPGNRGALVLRRPEGDVTEIFLVSLWESMDAVRAFAGPRPERAVYYPEDDAFLLDREPTVAHYEIADLLDPRLTGAAGS